MKLNIPDWKRRLVICESLYSVVIKKNGVSDKVLFILENYPTPVLLHDSVQREASHSLLEAYFHFL
jgi:hypothetical protein